VGSTIVGDPLSHDHARIIDSLCHGEHGEVASRQIRNRVEIDHFAIRKEKGVNRTVRNRGKAHDESGRVNAEGAALVPPQRAEISRYFIRAPKGMISRCLGNIGRTDDVRGVVRGGRAAGTGERAQILHLAVLEKKGMNRAIRDKRRTDDMAVGVDVVRGTCRASERSEVGNVVTQLRLSAAEKK
jgi:hypothetical protein